VPTPDEYRAAKLARREERRKADARRRRWVPLLEAVCKHYKIEINEIPGGYQFRSCEYIVSWWPSTNKINIQYPGSSETRKFEAEPAQGEPKVVTALRKLIKVTKGEEPSNLDVPTSTPVQ
jgi:hypothetical protein